MRNRDATRLSVTRPCDEQEHEGVHGKVAAKEVRLIHQQAAWTVAEQVVCRQSISQPVQRQGEADN